MSLFVKFCEILCIRCIYCGTISSAHRSLNQMSNVKRLAAFDFDNTIIVDNSDTVVRDLLPKDVAPKYVNQGWILYMQVIFEMLHKRDIQESTITNTIIGISPVTGMCDLIKGLVEDLNFDVIIISDSNTHFISKWLEQKDLLSHVKQIFTNPAKFLDGLLKIDMYHVQDSCSLSSRNLCKGQILEDFIKAQKEAGVAYKQVIYVGDGQNDFCPILRLNPGDLACCREGYKCANIVNSVKEGKLYKQQSYEIKADIMMWTTGFDILGVVRKKL